MIKSIIMVPLQIKLKVITIMITIIISARYLSYYHIISYKVIFVRMCQPAG